MVSNALKGLPELAKKPSFVDDDNNKFLNDLLTKNVNQDKEDEYEKEKKYANA